MNLTRYLEGAARFCMAPDGAGAPAAATADTSSNASAAATVTVGEAAKVSTDQISGTATVPATVGTGETKPAADFRDGWSDELKNNPTLKDFKDPAALAQAFVETKKLVGQKLGIPGADATPEAKAAFYEAMGVPKDAAGYEFKTPDNLPEALKAHYDEGHAKKWADLFHKHNVPKEVANALRGELFSEISAEIGDIQKAADTSERQFQELATSIYGDQKKASEALQGARTIIERHLPPALKDAMSQLPNTALLAVAAAISGETKNLTGEDKTISRDNGTSGGGQTVAQLREEARGLMKLPEYTNMAINPAKHREITDRVQQIYKQIGTSA